MTDWSKVNKVIEKVTGKPTPSKESINKFVEESLRKIKEELEKHV